MNIITVLIHKIQVFLFINVIFLIRKGWCVDTNLTDSKNQHEKYYHKMLQQTYSIDIQVGIGNNMKFQIPKGMTPYSAVDILCFWNMNSTSKKSEILMKNCRETYLQLAIPILKNVIIADVSFKNVFGEHVYSINDMSGDGAVDSLSNSLLLVGISEWENRTRTHKTDYSLKMIYLSTIINHKKRYEDTLTGDTYSRGYCSPLLTCPLSLPIAYLESPRCSSTSIKKWISDREFKYEYSPTEWLGHYPRTSFTCCEHGFERLKLIVVKNPFTRLISYFSQFLLGKYRDSIYMKPIKASLLSLKSLNYFNEIHSKDNFVVEIDDFHGFINNYVQAGPVHEIQIFLR